MEIIIVIVGNLIMDIAIALFAITAGRSSYYSQLATQQVAMVEAKKKSIERVKKYFGPQLSHTVESLLWKEKEKLTDLENKVVPLFAEYKEKAIKLNPFNDSMFRRLRYLFVLGAGLQVIGLISPPLDLYIDFFGSLLNLF